MSYGWRIAGDAMVDLADLEPWLQEDVLDEVERMALTPTLLHADARGYAAHQVIRTAAGMVHAVFMRMHRDDARGLVVVLGISDQKRAEGGAS